MPRAAANGGTAKHGKTLGARRGVYITPHANCASRGHRITTHMDTPAPDVVQQATQLLTHFLHCRKESEGLQACHAQHGVGSEYCTRHAAAFTTCANASMMQIVDGLVKIADKFCAEEVAAYQRCKQQGFGDEACETLDLAALQAWRLCSTPPPAPLQYPCSLCRAAVREPLGARLLRRLVSRGVLGSTASAAMSRSRRRRLPPSAPLLQAAPTGLAYNGGGGGNDGRGNGGKGEGWGGH